MILRKILATILIIVGILIMIYPQASEWYDNRQQERLLAEWESSSLDEIAEEARRQYEGLTTLFAEEPGNNDPDYASATAEAIETLEETDLNTEEPEPTPSPKPETPKQEPIASIKIAKIKLNLPVLKGATQKNMKYAAAHLTETTGFGQVGNAAIAAHRMRAKGSLFNRLNEVEIGDKIVIETKDETFTYTVNKVSIVEPSDVSVLNYNDKDKRLTLITCDPVVNPTHRLIVHAEM